jgi:hypothetical protein
VGQRRAGGPHDAEEVDVEHTPPLFERVLLHAALRANTRVVDEDVETAELFRGIRDRLHDRRVVADVGLQ